MRAWIVRTAIAVALTLLSVPAISAQGTGSVTGTVVDLETLQPLPGAQVFIPGTRLPGRRGVARRRLRRRITGPNPPHGILRRPASARTRHRRMVNGAAPRSESPTRRSRRVRVTCPVQSGTIRTTDSTAQSDDRPSY